jgi:enolase-phosphatase E1
MIRAILTDIEGTTSSLAFVKEVLFPYARRHIDNFVRTHQQQAMVAQLLNDVRREAGDATLSLDGVIAQLIHWIDQDKKITPLKALQGLIWEQGYRDGDFHGHIYADALAQLRAWHAQGIQLAVYSSGSVQAQKLLFAHTQAGDLTPLFSHYFDTTVGAKINRDSYMKIAKTIGLPGEEILFLSDIQTELDAAKQAGLHTCWLVRDATPDPHAAHRQVKQFDEIRLNNYSETVSSD